MSLARDLLYLLSASLFILGIKRLGSPRTARQGNLLASLGMLIAVVVTLADKQILDFTFIIAGLVIGSLIGIVAAKKVAMTAMPQMVALFNSFGGGASALVAFAEYLRIYQNPQGFSVGAIAASVLIGAITFSGSVVAFAKLQGLLKGSPIVFKGHRFFNLLVLAGAVAAAVWVVGQPDGMAIMLVIAGLSLILGITGVIPIGGADMPVVIALLNSLSGLAAAATGFVLSSSMLIIAGTLVGTSGLILTNVMCRAMNRTLGNVLFGAVGSEGGTAPGQQKQVTAYTPEDAAIMLHAAQDVIVVPGYGLAVAQAQHALQELATFLQKQGTKVRFAIHPVAGRMPGHMNVLLAEAHVPYDHLYEMDSINEEFQNADVALVIGANDVINPVARTDKNGPLYGMPILNVDQAKSVMIIKRSLSAGFAGVDNPLFYDDRTMMIFGDAKKMVTELNQILKGN